MGHGLLGITGYVWIVVLVAAASRELISFYFFAFTLLLTQWLFFPPAVGSGDFAMALGLIAAWNEAAWLEDHTGQISGLNAPLNLSPDGLQQTFWGAFIGLTLGSVLCYGASCQLVVPVAGAFLGAFLFDLFTHMKVRQSLGAALVILEAGKNGRLLKMLIGGVILIHVILQV